MPVGDQYGIIRVRSNAELSAEEEAAAMEAEQDNREAVITELAAHCRTEWQRARDAKQPLEIEMLNALLKGFQRLVVFHIPDVMAEEGIVSICDAEGVFQF